MSYKTLKLEKLKKIEIFFVKGQKASKHIISETSKAWEKIRLATGNTLKSCRPHKIIGI